MHEMREDFGHARSRDSFPLFDRKRMIGRFQLDIGADPVVPKVEVPSAHGPGGPTQYIARSTTIGQ